MDEKRRLKKLEQAEKIEAGENLSQPASIEEQKAQEEHRQLELTPKPLDHQNLQHSDSQSIEPNPEQPPAEQLHIEEPQHETSSLVESEWEDSEPMEGVELLANKTPQPKRPQKKRKGTHGKVVKPEKRARSKPSYGKYFCFLDSIDQM